MPVQEVLGDVGAPVAASAPHLVGCAAVLGHRIAPQQVQDLEAVRSDKKERFNFEMKNRAHRIRRENIITRSISGCSVDHTVFLIRRKLMKTSRSRIRLECQLLNMDKKFLSCLVETGRNISTFMTTGRTVEWITFSTDLRVTTKLMFVTLSEMY